MQINIIFLLFIFLHCFPFLSGSSFFLVDGFIFSGATAPLGFWDPLEISKRVDIGHLAFLRESELKHSRWSMMSCISMPMIESQTHYPAIHGFDSLDLRLKIAIIVLISGGEFVSLHRGYENPFLNLTSALEHVGKLKLGYQPGDMGFGVIQNMDFIEHDTINNLELNHGRFAMISSIIIFLLEGIYGVPLFATSSLDLLT